MKEFSRSRDLSDAEIEGRRQMRQIIAFLRKDVPGFANATIRSVACVVGIRESRRIIGQVYQTKDDFINRSKYPDGIAGDELCRLIVLNTASIQLIPANVAAIRAGLGSASPFDILPAVWVTSVLSVTAGIAAAKLCSKLWRD